MRSKENKKSLKIIIAVIVGVFVLFALISLSKRPQPLTQQYLNQPKIQNTQLKTHTSQALKISFQYPKDWYVDDRYRKVLITNYKTNLNRDDKPSKDQMEIVLNEFSNCFKTLDEDMINPACGEGGLTKKNKIVSKTIKEVHGGSFYRYSIVTYSNQDLIYYFVQKGNRNIRISKQPDPSKFEKEFEELVGSIEFL